MKSLMLLAVLSWVLGAVALAQTPDAAQAPDKPADPPAVRRGSPKKGVGVTTLRGNQDTWRDKVKTLNARWHYSWGPVVLEEAPNVEFVPMMWTYRGKADEKFHQAIGPLTQAGQEKKVKHLLGFNEPDSAKQANVSVEQALEAWPALMKTGLRLGSPVAVHADGEWMRDFMKQAQEKKYRVDFICVHAYPGTEVKPFLKRLEKIHQLYGKPIWITEFAVADWKAKKLQENKYSPEDVLFFMKQILPALDSLDFVERYAWFPAGKNSAALAPSALFNEDGSLTKLGEYYANH